VPRVRARRGSFSGPMTISATAPISAILEMPRSIMRVQSNHRAALRPVPPPGRPKAEQPPRGAAQHTRWQAWGPTFSSGLLLGFDVDGGLVGRLGIGDLAGRGRRLVVSGRLPAFFHTILETLDGTAEVGADVFELFGAEHHHHDQQHDQPVPNGKSTHDLLL